ncbi:uncharacterized protein BDR25DRAFT_320017 [Lindgomyces ingoldianus]|uniref:Uncharacterized protein n=1 Tax=Lindgomyces ingoldianus TaxID=673940 RepID=A0ACB6Q8G4_9PLEO|nr:uncharacterized protein BDR25DRAFT_320017 [Lindgomyces ingoldianus]KAF2463319.1 hypothetical protein BDR25DRAFT_320017 [Lindgomyces ingoldianus]
MPPLPSLPLRWQHLAARSGRLYRVVPHRSRCLITARTLQQSTERRESTARPVRADQQQQLQPVPDERDIAHDVGIPSSGRPEPDAAPKCPPFLQEPRRLKEVRTP